MDRKEFKDGLASIIKEAATRVGIPKSMIGGDSNYSSARMDFGTGGFWTHNNIPLIFGESTMGCDIHLITQVRRDGKWVDAPIEEQPFNYRDYGLFSFLADVRNYSEVPPISKPKGFPEDFEGVYGLDDNWLDPEGSWAHSHSWLTLRELVEYNYDQVFWDRRVTKQTGPNSWDGAATALPGEGVYLTVREFLGEQFWDDLTGLLLLQESYGQDDIRIVFCFDN